MKNYIKVISILFVLVFVFLSGVVVFAEGESGGKKAVDGLKKSANQGYLGKSGDSSVGDGIITSIPGAVGTIIGVALSFVGLAFFILMIYGGFIWMFARGNDQDVTKAKDIIRSAIIGIIIVLSAYAVTVFIGNALTGGGDVNNQPEAPAGPL